MPDRATIEARYENIPNSPEELPAPEAGSAAGMQAKEAGVHPAVAAIGVGGALWFLAMAWLSFAHSGETDYLLVIVTLFFVMFFGLFLLVASYTLKDPRWAVRKVDFRHFLTSEVGTATGEMSGRDVLIQASIMPVSLAFAATLIGLARVVFG